MVRAFVLYEGQEPEAERYEQHNRDFSSKVPGATFRHGAVFGAAVGEPKYKYYAEFECAGHGRVQGRHPERGVRRDRQGRDGDGNPVQRLLRGAVTEPTRPAPLDPAELGFERIVYEKAPPRATIPLNRPEVLNAFDFQTLRELARACEDASWDDEIRVVVLTGTGRAFCVGADLKAWGEGYLGNPTEYWKWFGAFKDTHDRLREIGKPTLARINGICVGGGNELQMACDLAVMVDDAFIRHVGPEHGSVPAGGATQWLHDHGRRPPRARDHPAVRGDPGAQGRGVGARQPRRAGGGAGRRGRPRASRAWRASSRRRRATRSST